MSPAPGSALATGWGGQPGGADPIEIEAKEAEQFGFVQIEIHPCRLVDGDDRASVWQVRNIPLVDEVAGDCGLAHRR